MRLITSIMLLCFITGAFAAPVQRMSQNVKLPSQSVLEVESFSAPAALDADGILVDQATSNAAITTVIAFLAQPDFARIISILPEGVTADVPAGNVVVTGTNVFGAVITDNVAFLANAAAASYSTKAFKTITSIVFPIQDGAGATYDVGWTDALGLNRCMSVAGDLGWSIVDGVYEGTRATTVANATDVSKNVFDTNTAFNGAKNVKVYYVQNFGCFAE